MRIVKLAFAALGTLLIVGCIQVETLVKVKTDGSGTIEETFIMGRAMVQQMKEFGASMGEEEFSLLDEEELKKKTADMGEGVTYVSAEELKTKEGGEGYKAIYAFTDVSKLQVNQNPDKKKEAEYVTFEFTKGDPATLLIKTSPKEPDEASKDVSKPEKQAEEGKEPDEAALKMMQGMFKGFKITMAVEVQGTIVETNATHKEGSRVILMEMDFEKLLADEEQFKRLAKTNPQTLEASKELMKDIPGIKVELNEEVRIKFK